jgi:hypothetical protein
VGNDAFHNLVDRWRSERDTPLEPAVPSTDVRSVFASLGVAATQDVCDLFTITGGMLRNYPDDHFFQLWCVDRIAQQNSKSTWDYVWFADWLFDSYLYALRPINDAHSAVFIDYNCNRQTPPTIIADTLHEFAERLLLDPKSVGVVL